MKQIVLKDGEQMVCDACTETIKGVELTCDSESPAMWADGGNFASVYCEKCYSKILQNTITDIKRYLSNVKEGKITVMDFFEELKSIVMEDL